jgi:hypothetical protein
LQKGRRDHKQKREKIGFFGFFSDFFQIFRTDLKRMDNFWIILRVFWTMMDNL